MGLSKIQQNIPRGWKEKSLGNFLVISKGKLPIIFLTILVIVFWIYDGYFLSLERMYRDLYEKVRKIKEEDIDFSMDITEFKRYKKNSIIYCIFSPTLRYFYGLLLVATLYVIFFIK